MARVSEVYGGNWLEAEDVGDRQVGVTIESVTVHEMNDGKRKAALHFVGKEKALLLNVTNASIIEGMTGTDEMDAWSGTRLVLYKDPNVMYQGRRVGGLRVKAPTGVARPTPPPPPVTELSDEDIPF